MDNDIVFWLCYISSVIIFYFTVRTYLLYYSIWIEIIGYFLFGWVFASYLVFRDNNSTSQIPIHNVELADLSRPVSVHIPLPPLPTLSTLHDDIELQNRINRLEQRLQLQNEPNLNNNETVDLEAQIEITKLSRAV
ncbi:MAG: hypothetical protein MRERV_7c032 [Mycoplasmataceae bacterium RV_VA103A]|nr:MAG: hypothetical protein MRERV_7c032 [Mycoplasmataceae bacterium RV_VA103A]